MKKKILGLVLALCLMVPCAFMLVGCDNTTYFAGTEAELVDSIERVKEGCVVKLTSDITLTSELQITKAVVIDLNGFTVNNTTDLWFDEDSTEENAADVWSLISVRAGGELTIKNGEVVAKENDCYAIDVRYGGKLTIENGTYKGNISAIYVIEGEATINGGEFSIQQLGSAGHEYDLLLNIKDENATAGTGTIKVTGGRFANFNPNNANDQFVAQSYEVSSQDEDGTMWYEVTAVTAE